MKTIIVLMCALFVVGCGKPEEVWPPAGAIDLGGEWAFDVNGALVCNHEDFRHDYPDGDVVCLWECIPFGITGNLWTVSIQFTHGADGAWEMYRFSAPYSCSNP